MTIIYHQLDRGLPVPAATLLLGVVWAFWHLPLFNPAPRAPRIKAPGSTPRGWRSG